MAQFLLLCFVVGSILPWLPLAAFFADEGLNLTLFFESMFGNQVAAVFSIDLILSIIVFLVWAHHESRRIGLPRSQFLLCIPFTFLVGLSSSMPLFLYLRHKHLQALRPNLEQPGADLLLH